MESLYQKGPKNVPEGLTAPSKSFKKHIWLAILGLLLFIGLYITLMIWFGKLSYLMFQGEGSIFTIVSGIIFGFLSLFMVKSLFIFSKREHDPTRRYLNKADEPVLFDYLYKLADEAGAPRPHKVFLSSRVNASVSYDISVLNLLFPTKKNLEIGLGLVNVLSLGEFKAVLAHEFGHFAQRSMLLGRYVYVAHKIAVQIIARRDWLDSLLGFISSIDLRVAWIGWILSIFVWAIRALIEVCFSVVVIAERALSREMEFQADLVAVSLTGSDALIHALYKLQVADQGYNNATTVINEELSNKKAVHDLYALQSNYIEKAAWVLNEPDFGKSPKRVTEQPELHRVFKDKKFNPPQMWSTHPADTDREENAKRIYIPAAIDDRSSWDLFSDPMKYRLEMTASLVKTANVETSLLTHEESLQAQNDVHFNWHYLDPKYQSVYLNRFTFNTVQEIAELYDVDLGNESLKEVLNSLYPHALVEELQALKSVQDEIAILTAAQYEAVTAEKRKITHRGAVIKRKEIPDILVSLKAEEANLITKLTTHDKKCRTAHANAALKLDHGWCTYVKGLGALIHYAEHSIANLDDCVNKFNNVLSIVLADGRVSSSEMADLLNIAHDLHNTLRRTFNNAKEIRLNQELLSKLKIVTYSELYEEFKLGGPHEDNMNEWVNACFGWVALANDALSKLRNAALEELLLTEERIKMAYVNDQSITRQAPKGIAVPERYNRLLPGTGRSLQHKLGWWDRFSVGDGLVPTIAKFAVAAALIIGALIVGRYSQESDMYIYNGLSIPVQVTIDGQQLSIPQHDHIKYEVNYGTTYDIETTTGFGDLIERISTDFDDPSEKYIYNIAQSGIFIKEDVQYGTRLYGGSSGANNTTFLGAKRWIAVEADYVLEDPPNSITASSSSHGGTRTVIWGHSNVEPQRLLSTVEDGEEVSALIRNHALWDAANSDYILQWMNLLQGVNNGTDILKQRLARNEDEIESIRGLQNLVDSTSRKELCENYKKLSAQNPHDEDYYYLACRCIDDEQEKNAAFIRGYEKFKSNTWLAYASGYCLAELERWEEAYEAYSIAATGHKGLAKAIAEDAERVYRVIAEQPNSTRKGVLYNADVAYYDELESGKLEGIDELPDRAYYYMNKGKLDKAYKAVKGNSTYEPAILRLLAASSGVSAEITKKYEALAFEAGLNFNTIWSSLGLAIREHKEVQPFLAELEQYNVSKQRIINFIDLIKKKQFEEAEGLIKNIDFRYKAHYYDLGAVILENKVPKRWKQYRKALLYITERPFLK